MTRAPALVSVRAMKLDDDFDRDEYVRLGFRRILAAFADDIHAAIDGGFEGDRFHAIVRITERNYEDLDIWSLITLGRPDLCDDCSVDTTPLGEDGRPLEGRWEWYLVRDDVWREAVDQDDPWFLCIECLEERLGRRLTAVDFAERRINEPSCLDSARLADRIGRRDK